MVSESVFSRQVYPGAITQTFGTTPTRPKSGYFSLHFTYPDTNYEDPVETTWAAGGNQQGMHFLVRSPQAVILFQAQVDGIVKAHHMRL